jgi:oligoendopeptidase F
MPWKDQDRREEIRNGSYLPDQYHLFTHPFYYIEYDVAQISVFEFYKRSKEDFGQAWRDYFALCGTGGSLGYLDLLRVGGLTNPFSEGAVKKICTPALEELFETR